MNPEQDMTGMTPRERSAETKRRRTRAKFIDAGVFVLGEDGPAARIEDIAVEAGLSVPTFYTYYESRSAFIAVVFYQTVCSKIDHALILPRSDKDVPDTLDRFLRATNEAIREHPNIIKAALAARYDPMPELNDIYMTGEGRINIWYLFSNLASNLLSACNAWAYDGDITHADNQPQRRAAQALVVGMLDMAVFHPDTHDLEQLIPLMRELADIKELPTANEDDPEYIAALLERHAKGAARPPKGTKANGKQKNR
jgi:AcrR family transcriptional regulator